MGGAFRPSPIEEEDLREAGDMTSTTSETTEKEEVKCLISGVPLL
jgi:hypothetical protein